MMQDDLTHDNFDFRGFSKENRHETELIRDEEERSSKKPAKAGKAGKNKAGKNAKNAKDAGRERKAEKAGKAEKKSAASAKPQGKRPLLFTPMQLRGLTVRNRVWLPPMDMYSAYARDGKPTPFHYQHYVSRALGGFGLIIAEATAVCPEGRISPKDVGLWEDSQIEAWRGLALDRAGRQGCGRGHGRAAQPRRAQGVHGLLRRRP